MKLVLICVYLAVQLFVAESKSVFEDHSQNAPQPCHRSDPNFKTCWVNFMNNWLVVLQNGGIRLYGFPVLEPYVIPVLKVNTSYEDVGAVSAIIKNFKISNFLKFKIKDEDFKEDDFGKLTLDLNITHSKLSLEFEYELDGKLLQSPFHSEGSFKGKFADITTNLKFRFDTTVRKGVKYYTVDDFKANMHIGDGAIQLVSKNPEDQPTTDFVQDTFNQNPNLYMDIVLPLLMEYTEKPIWSLFDEVLAVVPAERLLLD